MTSRLKSSLSYALAAFCMSAISATANADLGKNAELDLTCTQDGVANPIVIRITSKASGSEVTLDGKTFSGPQLRGATEGGDPFLQAVNNTGGYNITIAGGDFQTAFEGSAVTSGSAKASVDLFTKRQQFGATCNGSFAFTPMVSALPIAVKPAPPRRACVPEPLRIATLLMAAADELQQIKKQHTTTAMDITCQHVARGVVEYSFLFRTCGMCLPTTALLKIQQDETPTYVDGAPTYVKSVTYAH